jgi:Uma2 family endonuclease
MALATARHRFTIADYHRMVDAGILAEDDRVELIDGEIVDMAPIGREHQAGVDRLGERFFQGLAGQVIVRTQGSIRLAEHLEPQPDIVLLRRRDDFYKHADAGPDDVLLIVEIADTSLQHDRDVKVPLYASTGIPEVWLADLNGQRVIVYREPSPEGYRAVRTLQGAERLAPLAFPALVLTAGEVLG